MITIVSMEKRRFPVGHVTATAGAIEACGHELLSECFARHVQGDWGVVCVDDRQANEAAVKDGLRILSAYPIDPAKPCQGFGANTLWIITEADRSATTFLLPEEY